MGENKKEELFIEVELNSNTIKYYRNLGYEIPTFINKQNKITTPKGTKIKVKEEDLLNKRLIGKKFGKLTVVDYDDQRSEESYIKKQYYRFWLCKCDCGNDELISVNQMNLLTSKSTSCGCMFKKKIDDLTSKKFNRLEVIKLDSKRSEKSKRTFWLCKCDCGNEELISIEADSLNRGDTQSCGCIHKESVSNENNYNWKGGITELYQHLRNKIIPWTIDTLIKFNRKCIITNKRADVVHHLINFSDIVQESLKELSLPIYKNIGDYSKKDLDNLDDLVVEKHYKYNCGIPLCENIHIEFHKMYGYKNNTIEQFLNFVDKIQNNEVAEIPYWTDNKSEDWKKLIDNKLKEITI